MAIFTLAPIGLLAAIAFMLGLAPIVSWYALANVPLVAGALALLARDYDRSLLGLALVAAGFLAAAGIGLLVHAEWWRLAAVVGLAVSFGLMVLYFSPWFLFIEAVNAGLLIGILWLDTLAPSQ